MRAYWMRSLGRLAWLLTTSGFLKKPRNAPNKSRATHIDRKLLDYGFLSSTSTISGVVSLDGCVSGIPGP